MIAVRPQSGAASSKQPCKEAPQDTAPGGRGGVTVEYPGGTVGSEPGSTDSQRNFVEVATCTPIDCQSVRTKALSTGCPPLALGRKRTCAPRDAPLLPFSRKKTVPPFPSFLSNKSSLSLLKWSGGHMCYERRRRVGHCGDKGSV